jgi:hypothetical protein
MPSENEERERERRREKKRERNNKAPDMLSSKGDRVS